MPRERAEALAAQTLDIWPENEMPILVFAAMQTQWRIGMAGSSGLDYSALPVVEARLGVGESDRYEVFAALQLMERAALTVFAERRQ